MSEKETNEILEEQRRARQEFLELKKMQSGEMEAPPKPSEVAIVPKTPKEKWDNFWFQYKWYVVAITAVTVVLAVLITQCATRTKYDMEVVYFTYTAALDEQTNAVAKYIAGYAEDVNGDGEINIQVVNCSFNGKSGDTQYRYTMMTKLQAMIAGDQNAMLFITDEDSYKYLADLSNGDGLFDGEPFMLGEEFYKATETDSYGKLPEGLRIACRRVSYTVLESKKGSVNAHTNAEKTLEAIKSGKKN
mgnify:FL=1